MGEKLFSWDDIADGLTLPGGPKVEDEQTKGKKRPSYAARTSDIYCPHSYLILNFHETLNTSEKIKYRKHYLRKVPPSKPNVIILQDIKDLVMYLLATPVGARFVSFFHLPIVDRFLRGLIIYFQYYVEIWERLMQERAATMKKAPNPLAGGKRLKYAEEMRILRGMLGREYADLVVGCQDHSRYHHMTAGRKQSSTITQSQGEKDLRIFEALIGMAHRVVWIALQRKYYTLIEVELHRLLRTDAYNTAERKNRGQTIDTLEDDRLVLHGPRVESKGKLLRNSPLIQELIYSDCDYRVLSLGVVNIDTEDPLIIYLNDALLCEEEKLSEFKIRVGILGHERSKYDVMLMPNDEGTPSEDANKQIETDKYEMKNNAVDKISKQPEKEKEYIGMPRFKECSELGSVFQLKILDPSPKGRRSTIEESKKKWLDSKTRRHAMKQSDNYSITATMD